MYKEKCGFMRIGCCTFKPEHCRPKQDCSDTDTYCDLYSIEFTSKAVKEEKRRIKKEINEIAKKNLSISKVKEMRKLEKENKDNLEVIEYKKEILKMKDLSVGHEYLEKAYIHLKRSLR